MRLKGLLVGVFIACISSNAIASGPYVSAGGGVSILHESDLSISGLGSVDVSYDTGMGFVVGAGYDFDGVRLEGEFGYRNADVDKISGAGGSVSVSGVDMTIMSYMANGYFDIKSGSLVTPYVGGGVGMIKGEMDFDGDKLDDTVFGYQLTAGLSFAANQNVTFDLYYRLQGAGSDFEKDGGELSYLSSNIFAGMRLKF